MTRRSYLYPVDSDVSSAKALAGDGGNDNTGGMDLSLRVSKLEDAVMAIRIDLAEIKGKLSHMPTTWSLVVIVIGVVFTVMAGTLGIVKLLHP
jgi:hypothetical protein